MIDQSFTDSIHDEADETYFSDTQSKTGSITAASESSFSVVSNENRLVRRSKKCVLLVFLIAGTLLGLLVYWMLSREEHHEFELHTYDFAVEISELVHHEANNVFLEAKSMSTTVTSYASATGAIWPFVTIPHFEMRGIAANRISNSLMTAFSPLVQNSSRAAYEAYSVKYQGWIEEGVNANIKIHEEFIEAGKFEAEPISTEIFRFEEEKRIHESSLGMYLPVWQLAPAPHDDSIINFDLFSHPVFSRVYQGVLHTGQPVLSEVLELDFLYGGSIRDNVTHPHSFLLQPVYGRIARKYRNKDIVGFIISVLGWDDYFTNIFPQDVNGIIIVLEDTCDQVFTYIIHGKDAVYLGPGDLHDEKYDDLVFRTEFAPSSQLAVSKTREHCEFFLNIYPTRELEEKYKTNKPVVYTIAVLILFGLTCSSFVCYDYFVSRRNEKVVRTAKNTDALISSLFPKNVRDRIMMDICEEEKKHDKKESRFTVAKDNIRNFLNENYDEPEQASISNSKPIADLFPSATVLFADIAGFTAWSSEREPTQVFQLLESLYHSFDQIAKRRKVFKVETVGDCYVAVCGLPEPRLDHAVVMARFARDCTQTMNNLSKKLEETLGPDTGDLSLRVGLHSGPVTAGVLRGEKSRFQLFGDTVNTASRVESTGERNRIHLSQDTADLLIAAGKSNWITPREDEIFAKGKGVLKTYWLSVALRCNSRTKQNSISSDTFFDEPTPDMKEEMKKEVIKDEKNNEKAESEEGTESSCSSDLPAKQNKKVFLSEKAERLVRWNSDVLARLLKQIVARRNASGFVPSSVNVSNRSLKIETTSGETVLDEVVDMIKLPRFDAKAAKKQENPNKIVLDSDVTAQLNDYVTIIASMYRDNAFHNFEHASHVTMSVVKLLSRIVAPDDIISGADDDISEHQIDRHLHDHTYGITSDPLTQFCVVWSALIHDVDHNGVANAQLVKENADIAKLYKNKSVAEQNSVDIAWDLLMDDSFKDLRNVIYTTREEMNRFRQLVVNTVMATDIVDKELKERRNARWNKAFHQEQKLMDESMVMQMESREDVNRKATIVIEHLIQASDVAHTMQHWHIYRKWNERFFLEMLAAYESGRADVDPCSFWYKGEIGFFDFYIIPLAKKLKECGVFGVSCDEYLNYAMTNRKEWEQKGESIVAELIQKHRPRELC